MQDQPDIRLGLPSASSIARVHFCPASHKMELEAEKVIPDKRDDAMAQSGELTHDLIAGDATDEDAPYRNVITAEMCEEQAESLLGEWRGPDSEGEIVMLQEKRYFLTLFGTVIEEPTDATVFSGQFDRLYIQGTRGFLADWKTLNGKHAAAHENRQLAAYVVLIMIRHKLTSLRVALVQPWIGKPTICDYDADSFKLAHDLLLSDLLAESQATPDDRKAGEWCHHCKARFGCEVFKALSIQEVERIQPMSIAGLPGKEQAAAMFARAMEFTPEQHIAAYRGLGIVGRYKHAIESSFEARVEAGEIPNWKIETTPGNREITNAQKAHEALLPLGVTSEDIIAACKLPIGAMEQAVRKRSGIKSQTGKRTLYNLTAEQAKDALNRALEEAGTLGRKADRRELVEVGQLEGGEP